MQWWHFAPQVVCVSTKEVRTATQFEVSTYVTLFSFNRLRQTGNSQWIKTHFKYRCSRPQNHEIFSISDWEFEGAVQVTNLRFIVSISETIPENAWKPFKPRQGLPLIWNKTCVVVTYSNDQVMSYCWNIEPRERPGFADLLHHLDPLVNNQYEETEY